MYEFHKIMQSKQLSKYCETLTRIEEQLHFEDESESLKNYHNWKKWCLII